MILALVSGSELEVIRDVVFTRRMNLNPVLLVHVGLHSIRADIYPAVHLGYDQYAKTQQLLINIKQLQSTK